MKNPILIIFFVCITILGCTRKPFLWNLLNESGEDYWVTSLTGYAFEGDLSSVKKVLANGTLADAPRTKLGKTALSVAVQEQHYKIVEVLMKAGANPMMGSSLFDSPIGKAVMHGDLVSFNMMQSNAHLTVIDNGKSLLWWACAVCQTSLRDSSRNAAEETILIVHRLLDAGCKPDEPSPEGETPIVHAARWDKFEIMRLLYEAGADPNYSSKRYGSALEIVEKSLATSTKILASYQEELLHRNQGDSKIGTMDELKLWITWEQQRVDGCKRTLELFKGKARLTSRSTRTPPALPSALIHLLASSAPLIVLV